MIEFPYIAFQVSGVRNRAGEGKELDCKGFRGSGSGSWAYAKEARMCWWWQCGTCPSVQAEERGPVKRKR